MFKIVSVGWDCEQFIEQTLASIEAQSRTDWEVQIVIDPSGDKTADLAQQWCDARDDRWNCTVNSEQRFAVRNQVDAIDRMSPNDEDIIVWLDADGDRFAHPGVLDRLAQEYDSGDVLLTYGSFLPVPENKGWVQAKPFPKQVVRSNSFREHILNVECCFNHLRTMKGVVYRNIPRSHFHWSKRPDVWYDGGTDYIFMVAGMELAGERYRCIDEVLCLYNNANPNADYLKRSIESSLCSQDYLRKRTALQPLEVS